MAAGSFGAVMVIVAVLIWFFGENLVRIFNTEPELVKVAGVFLRI
jgi:Na+-driven multidrug efflux pump